MLPEQDFYQKGGFFPAFPVYGPHLIRYDPDIIALSSGIVLLQTSKSDKVPHGIGQGYGSRKIFQIIEKCVLNASCQQSAFERIYRDLADIGALL